MGFNSTLFLEQTCWTSPSVSLLPLPPSPYSNRSSCLRVSQKTYRRLINNRTKAFCSIFQYFSILNKAHPKLDSETKIAEIRCKLSEIYCSEVEHSKFNRTNFGDFLVVNFHISCKLYRGADRYVLFSGPVFIPAFVLSQPNFSVKCFLDKGGNSFQKMPTFGQKVFNINQFQDFAEVTVVRYVCQIQ